MLSLWNSYLVLSLSLPLSLHVIAFTGENVKEMPQPDSDTAVQRLTQPSQRPHGSGLAAGSPAFGPEDGDFLGLPLNWPLLTSEESDSQGVIGEYTDLQESTETPLLYSNEKGFIISRPTDSSTEDATSKESTQPQPTHEQQTLKYQSTETRTGSLLRSPQTGENQPTVPASQNETTDSQLPFLLSGSLPSGQNSTSQLSAGPGPSPEQPISPVPAGNLGWTTGPSVITQGKTQEETVSTEEDKDVSKDDDLHVLKTSGTLSLDANTDTSPTPCKTSNQPWTPTYPDDFTPNESLHPSLVLSPALFVPLYSDWNSALATWGFAWEAHVYGLGPSRH
ncbi:uncharacterized protein prrt4a isoform X3 [Chaetodon auriga]|uniref:uncharacterized protein prrt4a isoform X3 n=1 Tax=Chaetodon auriga TaxID=39042 RepID=UPI004032CA7A